MIKLFQKFARCGAELHGLNRRSRWKKSSGRGARAQRAIAPGAGSVAPCLPFPPASAKGRRTLSRAGQAGLRKSSAGRGPAQEVSPAGSVGAERCPPGTSAPRRGVLRASGTRPGPTGAEAETLTENSPLDYFPIFLRLPKATKAARRCLALCKPFEKGLSENFTCLYLTLIVNRNEVFP